jgi:hypothetical protein
MGPERRSGQISALLKMPCGPGEPLDQGAAGAIRLDWSHSIRHERHVCACMPSALGKDEESSAGEHAGVCGVFHQVDVSNQQAREPVMARIRGCLDAKQGSSAGMRAIRTDQQAGGEAAATVQLDLPAVCNLRDA